MSAHLLCVVSHQFSGTMKPLLRAVYACYLRHNPSSIIRPIRYLAYTSSAIQSTKQRKSKSWAKRLSVRGLAIVHYERRRPEETKLYQWVQEHAQTFFAHVQAETGACLPEFVKEEFAAFLECGILAHGFLSATLWRMRP